MPFENSAGIGVNNHYGTRNTGYSIGVESTSGGSQTLTVHLTGESLNNGFMPPVFVPKGALITSAVLVVDEAFAVSTGGTVAIGGTAPATNGVVLTEAKLEAVGASDVSALAVGTWATNSATGTTAAQRVSKAVTGTVTSTVGKAQLVITFVNRDKV
jgi:hypothetical protein